MSKAWDKLTISQNVLLHLFHPGGWKVCKSSANGKFHGLCAHGSLRTSMGMEKQITKSNWRLALQNSASHATSNDRTSTSLGYMSLVGLPPINPRLSKFRIPWVLCSSWTETYLRLLPDPPNPGRFFINSSTLLPTHTSSILLLCSSLLPQLRVSVRDVYTLIFPFGSLSTSFFPSFTRCLLSILRRPILAMRTRRHSRQERSMSQIRLRERNTSSRSPQHLEAKSRGIVSSTGGCT